MMPHGRTSVNIGWDRGTAKPTQDAKGITACSRRSNEERVTPPDLNPTRVCTLEGVPAIVVVQRRLIEITLLVVDAGFLEDLNQFF